jgi:hypothetical protein
VTFQNAAIAAGKGPVWVTMSRRARRSAATELAQIPDANGRPIAESHSGALRTAFRRALPFGWAERNPLCPVASHVDLLGDCQGVIDLDAKISHGTFDLGVAQ